MTRHRLVQDLVRDEGMRLNAYQDTLGFWTIGVGHLLGETKRMVLITEREALALLESDIIEAEEVVRNHVKLVYPSGVASGEVRYRALVNMAFNLGNKLGQFKLFLAAMAGGDWEEAGKHMLDSEWAKQVGARATRLKDMIVSGADS